MSLYFRQDPFNHKLIKMFQINKYVILGKVKSICKMCSYISSINLVYEQMG